MESIDSVEAREDAALLAKWEAGRQWAERLREYELAVWDAGEVATGYGPDALAYLAGSASDEEVLIELVAAALTLQRCLGDLPPTPLELSGTWSASQVRSLFERACDAISQVGESVLYALIYRDPYFLRSPAEYTEYTQPRFAKAMAAAYHLARYGFVEAATLTGDDG